ncbi:MAG: RtcB family protein [Blastocatellia bacterium]|nr:RtcB family protein [Blastocatellia bacterium]
MQPNLKRLLQALARQGLTVTFHDNIYQVRLTAEPEAPAAEVLLPAYFPLEAKALKQLAQLAAIRHPSGGRVVRACATPDFHPGDAGIAIGSVTETEGMVIPAAVGTDINCGMRFHATDLPLERFLAGKIELTAALKGDLLLGTRDLPLTAPMFQGLFCGGIPGWLLEVPDQPPGLAGQADLRQIEQEIDRVQLGGSLAGHERWAPAALTDHGRTLIRDDGLGTVGGGNHFVELQLVEEIRDRSRAWEWGLRESCVAFMIHSGSRNVGLHIGGMWQDRARAAWPKGLKFPESGIFPLSLVETPELVASYLEAEATAANYGFLNRLFLAEMVRQRLREQFGDLEAPLVRDLPHNLTWPSGSGWIARKGACPAPAGEAVVIPGSMGTASYLLVGQGHERFLASASHGAGRQRSRFEMGRAGADHSTAALGLEGVECITLREERRLEEAPAAYKPIDPVIDAQVAAGLVSVVARMRPLVTFKA